MEYPLLKQPHSDLMPANLITLAHFSVSSTTNFSNSEGVMDMGATPRSASRPEILGSASPAFITPLSRSIGPGRRDRVPLHRGSNPNPGEKPNLRTAVPEMEPRKSFRGRRAITNRWIAGRDGVKCHSQFFLGFQSRRPGRQTSLRDASFVLRGMKGEAQHVCNPDRPSAIFLPGRVYHWDHNRGCEPAQLIDFAHKLTG